MANKQLTTYQAIRLHSVLRRGLKRCLTVNLKEYKMPLKEWALLGYVADAGPKGVRNTAAARHFSVEMPVITKVVTNGVKLGIFKIEDDPKDRRAQRIVATSEGLKKINAIEKKLKLSSAEWLGDIDPVMIEHFYTVLGALVEKTYETDCDDKE